MQSHFIPLIIHDAGLHHGDWIIVPLIFHVLTSRKILSLKTDLT